jgi:hypothetical protein
MDVGEALRQKYVSALQESSGIGGRPSMLLDALRKNDGDTIAQQATGFSGSTLDNTLQPKDLAALDAARGQLGREAFAQNAGRGVGSNTGQNLANQRTLDSIGNVSAPAGPLGALGIAIHHPMVAIPLGLRGNAVRAAAQKQIANTLASPEATAQALATRYATRIPDAVSMPGAVGANAGFQDHAAGGSVKPTFWDLAQQVLDTTR